MVFMRAKKSISLFIFLLSCFPVFAQMEIAFPVERTVFQRDNNNTGFVHIHGLVSGMVDRVEARLTNRVSGQGNSTDWELIDSEIEGNSFVGKIEGTGGWYRLELRALRDGEVVDQNSIERVGIGEVFVIAGQSNAQGDGDTPNARGANDDRVNAFIPNYYTKSWYRYENLPEYFDEFSFGRVNANTHIGPGGYTPWAYGELGDLLVAKLNVPVLFFNAATSGTSTQNWIETLYGGSTNHEFINDVILQEGVPYLPFRITIQSINSLLGIRTVLWHQGEYDAELSYSTERHAKNLMEIIRKSRQDINADLPWMVSRATRYYGKVNSAVIDAQNYVISNVKEVWAGPETDDIQPNRYDNAHFANFPGSPGLTQLAQRWNSALSVDFFNNSQPILAKDFIKLQHQCIGGDLVRFSTGQSYREYYWSNGSRNNSLEANQGSYSLMVQDYSGNIFRTNKLAVNKLFPTTSPSILTPDGAEGCLGTPFTLEVDQSRYSVIWNTGAVTNRLKVNNPGGYSAQFITSQNCRSGQSFIKEVRFLPPAEKPMLAFIDNDGNACRGEPIKIGITNVQGADILWSTGETGNEITITDDLNTDLTVTLFNRPNCPSTPSDIVNYSYYDNPGKAELIRSGPYFLYADNAPSEFINWYIDGQLFSSGSDNYQPANQVGAFQSQLGKVYTVGQGRDLICLSELSESIVIDENQVRSGVSVYPNPVLDSKIFIASETEKSIVTVRVYDEVGRRVHTSEINNLLYPSELDLNYLKLEGRVFVEVSHDAQTIVFPLVFIK